MVDESLLALAEAVMSGDVRALARAISLVEHGDPAGRALLERLFARSGRALLIGVTGPPGVGKSTLVDRLTAHLRRAGRRVAIIAVDPTSPFTGGALLGDRVRMQAHAVDPGVFIRSMATRGETGGLAPATADVALLFDAAGYDVVLIETVGVGQDEIDIVRTADVCLVVLAPGGGDDVQALKAGLMEIGDLFVVNKADRPGADRTVAEIEATLALADRPPDAWRPPVLKTTAATDTGVELLLAEIDRFRATQGERQQARRRARIAAHLRELLQRRFLQHVERGVLGDGELETLVERIAARQIDPYTAVERILERAVRVSPQEVS